MSKKDGGPAFPGAVDTCAPPGMSLRDYFASQALGLWDRTRYGADNGQAIAKLAYGIADAMLAEREK